MSDSVWPHRRQPTRLPRPWDSPGKNTSGLPFPSPMHESEKWKWSCVVVSDSLRPHGLQPTRLLHPWDFPGKSTGLVNIKSNLPGKSGLFRSRVCSYVIKWIHLLFFSRLCKRMVNASLWGFCFYPITALNKKCIHRNTEHYLEKR